MAIQLREPTDDDLEQLHAWEHDAEFKGTFNDFGQSPASETHRAGKPFIDSMHGTLIVERDGVPIGTVDWRPVMYGPPPDSMAYQLGISLQPESRGRGAGTEALRLVVQYLFRHTMVNRIEGSCDVANLPSQRMLQSAGLRFEGVNRGAQFRRGAYHDLMLYAVVRADVEGAT